MRTTVSYIFLKNLKRIRRDMGVMHIDNGKVVSKGIRKIMSNKDFVEYSFDLYDRTLDDKDLSNIRYTPSY